MNHKFQPLLPLAICMAVLQGCGGAGQRTDVDSQPPVKAESHTPSVIDRASAKATITPAPAIAEPVATTNPVTTVPTSPAETLPATPPTPADNASPALVNSYTVAPGDTLASIAARKEVYGDIRLWPLLLRANVSQIGPEALIFPKQVLIVDRKYTQTDIRALTTAARKTAPQVAAPITPSVVTALTTPAPEAAVTPFPAPVAAAIPAPVINITPAPTAVVSAPAAPPAVATLPEMTLPAQSAQSTSPAEVRPVQISEYLDSARQAFRARDVPWAIYYYSAYLREKNGDAAAWGELGNVYYAKGNLSEAAKSYYNAANLLIDRGQTARALDLIPAIEQGDPGLSAALYQRLTTIKR
jgi:hypothetical protein